MATVCPVVGTTVSAVITFIRPGSHEQLVAATTDVANSPIKTTVLPPDHPPYDTSNPEARCPV